jgi:hypothetical protein
MDEEDETDDDDNPGSDPDFGGKRRTVNTKLVWIFFLIISKLILYLFI